MKKRKHLLSEESQIEFAVKFCDEGCRSIIESGCVRQIRPRSKALYQFNIKDTDEFMLKDVESSLSYLRSRGNSLPFIMSEKDGFVWFDEKKN